MDTRGIVVAAVLVVAAIVGVGLWMGERGSPEPVGDLVEPSGRVEGGAPGAAADVPALTVGGSPTKPEHVAAPTQAARAVDVVVRHPDLSPAAHALVAVTQDTTLVAAGTAGRDGRFTVTAPPRSGTLDVWVAGVTYDVHLASFPRIPDGDLVVDLPGGAEVAGIVLVDGAAPTSELPIALRVPSGPRRDLPAKVDEALRSELVGYATLAVRRGSPTVDGRFRITGIPEDSTARLRFPRVFRTRGGDRTVDVRAPNLDVVIDLVRQPLLSARLVDEAGAPVVGARAEFAIFSGERWTRRLATSDGAGRVAVVLPDDELLDEVTIAATSASRRLRGRFVFEGVAALGAPDVGDLVLVAGRALTLRVVDEKGRPVEGAMARPIADGVDADEARSTHGPVDEWIGATLPTRADGVTHFDALLPDETRVEVVALGHAEIVVDVPPPPADAMTVVLQRGARLDVHFTGVHTPDGIDLLVSTDGPLCEGGDASHPMRGALGAAVSMRSEFQWQAGTDGPALQRTTAHFPAARRVVVDDLAPDTPLEVSAVSASGEMLWGPVEVVLAPGEWHRLDVEVREAGRRLEGRVVDGAGAPVAFASVDVVGNPLSSAQDRTDEKGRFVLDGLRAPVVTLAVEGVGFVPLRVEQPVADTPVEIVVERGRSVDVRVVDAVGRTLVPGARVFANMPGRVVHGEAVGPRAGPLYRLEHLPLGTVEFIVTIGERTWSRTAHTATDRVTIEVDGIGLLELGWPGDAGLSMPTLRIDDAATGASVLARQLTPEEQREGLAIAALPHGSYDVRVTRRAPGVPEVDAFAPRTVDVFGSVTRVELALPTD